MIGSVSEEICTVVRFLYCCSMTNGSLQAWWGPAADTTGVSVMSALEVSFPTGTVERETMLAALEDDVRTVPALTN